MNSRSLAERLDHLRRAVRASRDAVAAGELVMLAGLDGEVAAILAAAQHAKADERAALLSALASLRDELDGLESAIRRQHDLGLAQQAAGAYGAGHGSL